MSNKTWIGGPSGSFSSTGDWSPSGEPGVGDVVVINAGATVDFTATGGNSIEAFQELQLAAGAQLTVNSGDFEIAGPVDTVQSVGVAGVLQVNGGVLMIGGGALSLQGDIDLLGPDAMMQTAGPTLTLTDFNLTGGLMLAGGAFGGRIAGGGGPGTLDTLVNLSSVLHGSGYIGANAGFLDRLNILNYATIAADVAGLGLVVDDRIANDGGSLLATAGGTLFLDGSVDQTHTIGVGEGEILAAANSAVVLDSVSVISGSLDAAATGTLRIGNAATLDAVSIDTAVTIDSGATLALAGLIENPAGATIDGGAGSVVLNSATLRALDFSAGTLTLLGAANVFEGTQTIGTGFTLGTGQRLTFGDGVSAQNVMVNHVFIDLAGPNATLDIDSGSGPVQLSGGGELTLSDAGDRIAGTTAGARLENVDNIITGQGSIDNLATLGVDAGGSIIASGGGTLVLDAANIVSAGFLGADPVSTLEILGKLTNTGNLGGLIIYGAPLAGLINGTLENGSTLVVQAPGAGVDGLTNLGKIVVSADAVLTLTGDTENKGLIQLNGTGPAHPASIVLGGRLTGGGTIVFGPSDVVTNLDSTQFDNVDNHIEGSGNLGGAGFDFQNEGIVDANSAGNPLNVDPTTPTVRNLNLMEATAGGTLTVVGDLVDTDLDGNTQVGSGIGTLLASGAGSVVALLGGSVREGLIDSTGGGQVQVQGAETLYLGGEVVVGQDTEPYARDTALTNFSDLRVFAGQMLTLAPSPGDNGSGVLNNNATISLRGSAGDGATLMVAAATVELDAPAPGVITDFGGVLSLGNAADRIIGGATADVLVNQETIAGLGQIGAGGLHLTNNGTFEATDATAPLVVWSAGTFENAGALAIGAGAGGGIVLEGIVNDTGSLLNLGGAGTFVLGGADADGTLLDANINSGVEVDSSVFGSTIDAPFNTGTIEALAGETLVMAGLVNNYGTVEVQDGATLALGSATLDFSSGGGGHVLLDDAASGINGLPGQTLESDGNTISGAGFIGLGLIGFANASQASLVSAIGTLAIDTGARAVFNGGTLLAGAGDELDVLGAGGVDNAGTISAFGGTVVITGAVTDSGVLKLYGGRMLLQGGVSAGQTINISGFAPETLGLGMPTTAPLVFNNFQISDTIDLENVLATGSSFSAGVLHVSVGGSDVDLLQFPAGYTLDNFALHPDGAHGTDVVIACFAEGTRILTAHGEVAVEDLRVGDAVATLRGGRLAPVTWLGHRRVDCRRHPDPGAARPIRVLAGAFGPDSPHADLVLSPDHAVFVGGDGEGAAPGCLIPVRYLVNGRTVVRDQRDHVTYWHVELAGHDILLAEGLAAESYLDTGNRDAMTAKERPPAAKGRRPFEPVTFLAGAPAFS